MKTQLELTLSPEEAAVSSRLLNRVANELKVPASGIVHIQKLKQSIDARRNPIRIRLVVEVWINEPYHPEPNEFAFQQVTNKPEVHIIGAGPAGLFAALKLLELGYKSVIFERGKKVRERRRDLAKITREHTIDPDSNYCFGEGGAGTYSDGKLYTRSGKRGDMNRILKLLVYHGADEHILYEAHPHIGTNKLPHIIEAIRETILQHGGEIHFNTRLTDVTLTNNRITKLHFSGGVSVSCRAVILATGHSARDVFELLHRNQILIEAKPFALGVRIEHPQELIDSIQYDCPSRGLYLPPASYSLVEQAGDRGVFSFCMCPGGIIAPAATNTGEIVVNGWSPSKRNNPFANSGTVVAVGEKDFLPFAAHGALAAMYFQQQVEQSAHKAGGGGLTAPAQRLTDFVNKKHSTSLPLTSYLPGVKSVELDHVLPPEITKSLRHALPLFGKKMRGYFTSEAVMVGVESRTSSPVRIPRDKEKLHHVQIETLFPCAEGAGYAGGIVSAAMDGEKCAAAVLRGTSPG
ncbi:MAG: FAD-dependent oxidoreductase [Bacteroidia bacterium]|nr:FAD-dependent oxidoreductase [Bacteroidia bacterium]